MSVTQYDPNKLQAVILTSAALKHIVKRLKKESKQYFRISIKEAGCSGLQYVPQLTNVLDPSDYCFQGDIDVYVDKSSYPFLKGTHIDFIREGLNENFKYSNPNEAGSCGCGESFIVEDKSS